MASGVLLGHHPWHSQPIRLAESEVGNDVDLACLGSRGVFQHLPRSNRILNVRRIRDGQVQDIADLEIAGYA